MSVNKENSIYKNLHQKYVNGQHKERWVDLTWTHSNIVRQIALRIADELKSKYEFEINTDELEIGCLLHDIGVYSCFDEDLNPEQGLPPYIHHGHLGYEILLKEGFTKRIARFALTHTGTGFTVEDIKREDLPFHKEDYIPISLEEEILCYADKFHTKYPSFSNFDEQRSRLVKFDETKGVLMDRLKKKFGIPKIQDLVSEYDEWQKEFDEFFNSLSKK